jgi:hypothetical protein
VDVSDFLPQLAGTEKVSIKPTATLPKSHCNLAIWLPVLHVHGKVGRVLPDEEESALGYRLFQGGENLADSAAVAWKQDQMDMFGHENVCPEVEAMSLLRQADRVEHPASRAIT